MLEHGTAALGFRVGEIKHSRHAVMGQGDYMFEDRSIVRTFSNDMNCQTACVR